MAQELKGSTKVGSTSVIEYDLLAILMAYLSNLGPAPAVDSHQLPKFLAV